MDQEKRKRERRRAMAEGLAYIGQFAWSVLGPLLLCLFLAERTTVWFGWPRWVIPLGILLGLGGSVCGVISLFQTFLRQAGKSKRR